MQCQRVYLLLESTSSKVFFFQSTDDHNCDNIDTKTGSALTPEVKKIIEECVNQKMLPLEIIDKLSFMFLPIPKMYILRIANYKHNKYGPSNLKLSELRKLLDKYTTIPDNDETLYVLYDIPYAKNIFRFSFKSKTLIRKASIGSHLAQLQLISFCGWVSQFLWLVRWT